MSDDHIPNGTYAAVKFSKTSVNSVMKYIKDNNIINPVSVNELHTTLLHSKRHLPNYIAKGKIDPAYMAKPVRFDLWKTQSGIKYALVLVLNCPELINRHVFLMREHSASYDYPEYTPHITLSYNAGTDLDLNRLPQFTGDIKIIEEYSSELEE